MSSAALINDVVEWGVAGRALAGAPVSGDLHLVEPFEGGALAAVIDGLGHGREAAFAARAAATALSRRPGALVTDLIQLCHQELRATRGVVLSLASFDAVRGVVTWAGVGDVDGVLVRASGAAKGARESIPLRGGVVGYRLPPLREAAWPVSRGDLLILATDGVRHGFAATVADGRPPQAIAEAIIADHGRSTDDSLVLVVRYLGAAS
ncbi:SpoIIE family protein phosphatase [Phenylobacterium sp.]|uniref:SpoIIE family protein phosphatase n=1 Tax=Phenylobacterium sp. TaxID=1871053 RepID=UPI002733E91E|nr:SpoIIE family protein phosphatase [Phenylobacterium sp.]MDP3854072.1 SpoIIE family protein phosphatase [Phenylobacterium sp.]